jgi:hypothetical protein
MRCTKQLLGTEGGMGCAERPEKCRMRACVLLLLLLLLIVWVAGANWALRPALRSDCNSHCSRHDVLQHIDPPPPEPQSSLSCARVCATYTACTGSKQHASGLAQALLCCMATTAHAWPCVCLSAQDT